jgi:hypothetical protein
VGFHRRPTIVAYEFGAARVCPTSAAGGNSGNARGRIGPVHLCAGEPRNLRDDRDGDAGRQLCGIPVRQMEIIGLIFGPAFVRLSGLLSFRIPVRHVENLRRGHLFIASVLRRRNRLLGHALCKLLGSALGLLPLQVSLGTQEQMSAGGAAATSESFPVTNDALPVGSALDDLTLVIRQRWLPRQQRGCRQPF